MIYGSLCSGVEAASVAWKPLGWQAAWYSEIEKFPKKVLAHHYPNTPDLGDMLKIRENDNFIRSEVDLIVGGTPCQSFSVAGLRKGLDDERGNLALEFIRILQDKRPRWFVWENVPGVLSSSNGADFAAILSGWTGLDVEPQKFTTSGVISGGFYSVAWRVLDSQYFGVPQRRRRIFVVGYLGNDWRPPTAVLFDSKSLCGDTKKSKGKRKRAAATTEDAAGASSWPATTTGTLCHTFGDKQGLDNQHINSGASLFVPFSFKQNIDEHVQIDVELMHTLTRSTSTVSRNAPNIVQPVAYSIIGNMINRCDTAGANGTGIAEEVSPTLTKTDRHAVAAYTNIQYADTIGCLQARDCKGVGNQYVAENKLVVACYAFDSLSSNSMKSNNPHSGVHLEKIVKTLDTSRPDPSKNQGGNAIIHKLPPSSGEYIIRRLTPLECERLQGFPDNYTNIPGATDGARYAAMGNSMTVNVMRWIGERIDYLNLLT
jgi:DNA (cytosine-5)-methyltransferase 1